MSVITRDIELLSERIKEVIALAQEVEMTEETLTPMERENLFAVYGRLTLARNLVASALVEDRT